MQDSHYLEFDTFRLDLHDERLWRDQEVIPLHPKPFAVLVCEARLAVLALHGPFITAEGLIAGMIPVAAFIHASSRSSPISSQMQLHTRCTDSYSLRPVLIIIGTSHGMRQRFARICWQCPDVVPCCEAPYLRTLSRIMWS